MNNDRLTFRTPYYLPNPDGKNEFVGFAYWDATTGRPNMMVVWGNDEQCTGLRDENGNLIYENDVVDYFGEPATIVWDCCGFKIKTNDDICHEFYRNSIEIIGNVHTRSE